MDKNTIQKIYKYLEALEGAVRYDRNKYVGFKVCGTMFAEVTERQNYIRILVRNKYVTENEIEKLDISLVNKDKWTLDTELRIPKEGNIEKYLAIVVRAYNETKKDYDAKVKELIISSLNDDYEYITKYASDEEYAFEKLLEKWSEFISYEISNNDLDELKSDLQSIDKYNSDDFINRYSNDEMKSNFINIIFELVSYIDKSAYGKGEYNLYEDKRTLALINYKPNIWLENMINYKKYKDLTKVTALARNAILYILKPQRRITAFKLSTLQKFFKYIMPGIEIDNSYENLCEKIFDYLSFLNIDIVNENNRGIFYGRLIYSKLLYTKFDIENTYWKLQPYKDKNITMEEAKANISNNIIISKDNSLKRKANNNIFYAADENKPLFLGVFTDDAEEINDGFYKRSFRVLANTEESLSTLPNDKPWGSKLSSKAFVNVKLEEREEFEQKVISELFGEDIDSIMNKIKNESYGTSTIIAERYDEDEVTYDNDIATPLNLILYGPPGTGKTYNTVNYAVSIVEGKEIEEVVIESKCNREDVFKRYKKYLAEKKIVFTTFHQNYSYEEFIQGIRANTNNSDTLSFIKQDGIFKDLVERAKVDIKNNYVIVIDEINRGNISRIFGELITLIEDDKRLGTANETLVTLPSKEIFGVPKNLYIIGTMNTADKSIALIDIALRRRFDFIPMYPDYNVIQEFEHILKPINNAIYERKKNADYLIGHAFFVNKSNDDLESIVNKKLIPLLNEYFYSNVNDVNEVLLAGGIEVEMDMSTFQLKYKGIEE